MITAHLRTIPEPPDEIADVPEEISQAILKSLEKNPEDRFEDFAAFKVAMLGKFIDEPIGATDAQGYLEFSGEHYRYGAALLEMYVRVLKQYQSRARKFTVAQEGTQVELFIEVVDGEPVRITKDLEKIIAERQKEQSG